MIFDKVIMNPPYCRNLHLFILQSALENSNGEVVNLSPIRWLKDPLAKDKLHSDFYRFQNSISKYIDIIEELETFWISKLFNIQTNVDLAIYKCGHIENKYYIDFNTNNIVDKVKSKMNQSLEDVLEYNKQDGWRVRIAKMRPITKYRRFNTIKTLSIVDLLHPKVSYVYKDGYTKSGIHWSKNKVTTAGQKQYTEKDIIDCSISFPNEEQAINFENSTKTTFHRYYYMSVKTSNVMQPQYIYFLGKTENPRTHKIGYESDWTDEDLYKIFDISEEEQKHIQEVIKPYIEAINNLK